MIFKQIFEIAPLVCREVTETEVTETETEVREEISKALNNLKKLGCSFQCTIKKGDVHCCALVGEESENISMMVASLLRKKNYYELVKAAMDTANLIKKLNKI
jgi:hypothetical protein